MATPTSTKNGATTGSQSDAESVTHIQMAGLTVLMIKTKDQVIYKLPDNMSVQSLSTDQKERLLAEINLLHHQQTTAQAIAATQAQTQQVQMAQAQAQAQSQSQGVRPIAPLSVNTSGSASVSAASTPSASTPIGSTPSTPSTPTGNGPDHKTTRRYNKTGKYSKKKMQQQQELEARGIRSSTAGSTSSQPYPRPQDKAKISQPHQPLIFNNTNPQAYQALSASTQQQSSTTLAPIPSSILQQQIQQQQATGLSTVDQKRQFKLLQEIHQLQQKLEVQQTSINTFREHEKTIQRILAQNRPVDANTQQLARHNVADAEKALDVLKGQLREIEAVFREQFPVASQQLLLLQQQQAQAALKAGSMSGMTSTSALTSTKSLAPGQPKTIEEQLQQQIAEHHDAVRNGMTQEIQAAHKSIRNIDYRTPFSSLHDAIERLLPFHIYQYPAQDIDAQAKAFANRPEALLIHKRKCDIYNKYQNLIKTSATKPTTTNPSSALEILALRFGLEDEQEEHKKVSEEHESVKAQARIIQDDLERRQIQLLQQRRTEAALIEHQQKLILERQRQEELEKQQLEQQQQQMMAQIRQIQELQQLQQLEDMKEMHQHLQQQKESQMTEEQEEANRKEQMKRELERQHQLELEKQMRIKQEQLLQEAEAEAAARVGIEKSTTESNQGSSDSTTAVPVSGSRATDTSSTTNNPSSITSSPS
ncbi:hypothetical protein BGZ76_003754 [Entomortierella beljakovae]|nr:hypothetical protein BGZ76_003754 [Entomortierella beljakovae]